MCVRMYVDICRHTYVHVVVSSGKVKLEQSMANIERKYGEDFLASGAVTELPPPIHDMPQMIVTQGSAKNTELSRNHS